MSNDDLIDFPTKVKVHFFVPKVGSIEEIYYLDNQNDMICWSANQKLMKAVQTYVEILEFIQLSKEEYEERLKNRFSMKPYIDKQIAELRKRMKTSADDGE